MKISQTTFSGLLLVFTFWHKLSSTSAFGIPPSSFASLSGKLRQPNTASSSAELCSSISIDFEDAKSTMADNNDDDTLLFAYESDVRLMDLPKHGPSVQEVESIQTLMSLEMLIGRGAMLVAVLLVVNEVTTGQSLPEQLVAFFS